MSKIEYAKFQFMILVLESLKLIIILLTSSTLRQDGDHLAGGLVQLEYHLKELMEEK